MAGPYKLKLKKLEFLSAVDSPAQGDGARALLFKRKNGQKALKIRAKVAKTSDELGLVFGYAFASSLDGGKTPHVDYQADAIDDDFLKAAMEFVEGGGATDVNHDGEQDGRIVFAWPLIPDVNKALGIDAKTVGLAVAIKPSAETYKRFKSGELTGFSIAGLGERTSLKRAVAKAQWTTADIDDLPDSSFLYVEPGKKDADGKTTPRSLRHFPYRDANGKIDIDHLRDAIGRIPQSSLPATLRTKLQVKAEKLLAAQHQKRVTKGGDDVVFTDEVDGHQHAISLDDPACSWTDMLSTSYQTSEGADTGHQHSWTYDPATGAITIGADSGHTHTVGAAVPPEVLAAAAAIDTAEDAQLAAVPAELADDPSDAVPMAVLDEESSAKVSVTVIAARNSTRSAPIGNPGLSKTRIPMPNEQDTKIADLEKQLAVEKHRATLSDAQRAHLATLSGDDATAFLAKGKAGRDAEVIAASTADAVLYKGVDGTEYRRSGGQQLADMAKRLDEATALSKAQAARADQVELEKRAGTDLSAFGKSLGARAAILKAVDGVADEALRKEALEALKGANEAMVELGKARGYGSSEAGAAGDSPEAAYYAGRDEFAKTQKLDMSTDIAKAQASAAFQKTATGRALYVAITDAQAAKVVR